MKILLINNYHFLKGGSERIYFETTTLLQEKGHDVLHFSVADQQACNSETKDYFVEPVDYFHGDFFDRIRLAGAFVYSLDAKNKIERLIVDHKPDIAHLHIFYGRITSSILPVLRKYNIPTVMTVHEYKMLCPMYLLFDSKGTVCEKCACGNYFHCIRGRCNKGSFSYSFLSALECAIRDFFIPYEKYIDKFIMVSDFIQQKHLAYRECLREKVVRINNFANVKGKEMIANKNKKKDCYLYFGRLSREKGLMTLLKAWKAFPSLNLRIAGEGPLRKELQAYIDSNDMRNVELLGHLSGEHLLHEICEAEFAVLPSECFETFGLNIIESFVCKTPVIGANIGAISELINNKVNGFLFESGNIESLTEAIRLSKNLSERSYYDMQVAAQVFSEGFNSETYYKQLLQVYENVLTLKEI